MKASVASIDKRETVLLRNQITIDGTVLGKLNEMLVYGRDFHRCSESKRDFGSARRWPDDFSDFKVTGNSTVFLIGFTSVLACEISILAEG